MLRCYDKEKHIDPNNEIFKKYKFSIFSMTFIALARIASNDSKQGFESFDGITGKTMGFAVNRYKRITLFQNMVLKEPNLNIKNL